MNKWSFIDRVLPAMPCLLCGTLCSGAGLCGPCRDELVPNGPACRHCALPLPLDGGLCGRCLKRPFPLDHCLALLRFQPPLSELVHRLKFRQQLAVARLLGGMLAAPLEPLVQRPELIVPIPLHPLRLRERGYNQALELARPLARHLGIALAARLCRRVRATAAQTELDLAQRRRNLRQAFEVCGEVGGRHLVLVDDVMTTGSTLAELARTLRRAGAARVDAWVVARAVR